jgi:hypothetical protein
VQDESTFKTARESAAFSLSAAANPGNYEQIMSQISNLRQRAGPAQKSPPAAIKKAEGARSPCLSHCLLEASVSTILRRGPIIRGFLREAQKEIDPALQLGKHILQTLIVFMNYVLELLHLGRIVHPILLGAVLW